MSTKKIAERSESFAFEGPTEVDGFTEPRSGEVTTKMRRVGNALVFSYDNCCWVIEDVFLGRTLYEIALFCSVLQFVKTTV